jgi:hypothetical protein
MITQARLIELFEYSPKWGLFTNRQTGKVLTAVDANGFIRVYADGMSYAAHRMAWLYVYGEYPTKHVTQKDGDRLNNSIDNLVLSGSVESVEKKRREMMKSKENTDPALIEVKFKRRLETLLKSGYSVEGNHLVRPNGDDSKTYLLSYDKYIRQQIA